jgi:hypothetical protein
VAVPCFTSFFCLFGDDTASIEDAWPVDFGIGCRLFIDKAMLLTPHREKNGLIWLGFKIDLASIAKPLNQKGYGVNTTYISIYIYVVVSILLLSFSRGPGTTAGGGVRTVGAQS